jgi:hypothetical protein
MKKYTCLILTFLILTGQVQGEVFKAPDILLDSKLDFDWSGLLVSRLRKLFKVYKVDDPFKRQMNGTMVVADATLNDYLPKESEKLIAELSDALGMNILHGTTKVSLQDFSYNVEDFKVGIKSSEPKRDGLIITSDFSASKLDLGAAKLSISLTIPGITPLQIDIINPKIHAKKDDLITVSTKIKIREEQDAYKFDIIEANFNDMAKALHAHSEDVELTFDSLVIPEVHLKVGKKDISLVREKVEKIINDNHEGIKGLLLAQASTFLEKGAAEKSLKTLENYKFDKEYWINSTIMSQIKISDFTSSIGRNNLEVNMPGDFCTLEKFSELKKDCVNNKVTQVGESRLNKSMHLESLGHMTSLIEEGNANIVASISEDYVNKLIATTIDAGFWKAALDKSGIQLGQNKVFVRLDEKGDSGTVTMDVVYNPKKLERLALGTSQIRFPLVAKVSIRIEKHEKTPVLIIRVNDVDVTEKTLMYGRPELNIVSSVKDIPRLKGKVIKAIQEKLNGMKNVDILDIAYPEFSGLGLEKVDFLSDGSGRMNAVLRLHELPLE